MFGTIEVYGLHLRFHSYKVSGQVGVCMCGCVGGNRENKGSNQVTPKFCASMADQPSYISNHGSVRDEKQQLLFPNAEDCY